MEKFVITGKKPLSGEIDVRGAKNAAFPVLAATILTKEDCIISNLPLIEDVYRTLELLESMGATVEWLGKRRIKVNTKKLDPKKIDIAVVKRFRGSVLFFGPLLARFGVVEMPEPGGDIIGARPIDTHLDAFKQIGVTVSRRKDLVKLQFKGKPKKEEIVLNEFSVTGTENILLFAAGLPYAITLKIADQDYQIQDLIKFLKKMGVKVLNPEPHVLAIMGKKKLSGANHTLVYDPMEAGTFILLSIAAKGDVIIQNVEIRYLTLFFKKLGDFGVNLEIDERRRGFGNVRVLPSPHLAIDRIQTFIYPGLHSDLQSMFGVLATQAKGSTLLHDALYGGRLKYLEELNKMGAEIYFADPHRAIINGPKNLVGTNLGAFDLRGGAAVISAALIAKGTSTIDNIYQVDRGYERIEERLQKLGAQIERITV